MTDQCQRCARLVGEVSRLEGHTQLVSDSGPGFQVDPEVELKQLRLERQLLEELRAKDQAQIGELTSVVQRLARRGHFASMPISTTDREDVGTVGFLKATIASLERDKAAAIAEITMLRSNMDALEVSKRPRPGPKH